MQGGGQRKMWSGCVVGAQNYSWNNGLLYPWFYNWIREENDVLVVGRKDDEWKRKYKKQRVRQRWKHFWPSQPEHLAAPESLARVYFISLLRLYLCWTLLSFLSILTPDIRYKFQIKGKCLVWGIFVQDHVITEPRCSCIYFHNSVSVRMKNDNK